MKIGEISALLVCDANKDLGSGHVMRQITLGNSLRSLGYRVRLLCEAIPDSLVKRANEFDLEVEFRKFQQPDPGLEDEILKSTTVQEIIVFDGYDFSRNCISRVYESNRRVVLIDDNGDLAEMPCHMILNQNLHATEKMYEGNKCHPHLLLGPNWALIRPEVVRARKNQNRHSRSGIFVAVGGTDPMGITRPLVEALKENITEKTSAAGGFIGASSLSPDEMALSLANSEVGVIACGTTTWEACCLGLPIVGLVIADNQIKVSESLHAIGLGESIDCRMPDWTEKVVYAVQQLFKDEAKRNSISLNGQKLVDGIGAQRVAMFIKQLFN